MNSSEKLTILGT